MKAHLTHRKRLTAAILSVVLSAVAAAQTPTWKAELLGTRPPSWSTTWAVAVDDSGLAVGNTYLSGYKRAWVAGLEQPLELLPLPPGANYSQANDVNSSGVVAGSVLFNGSTSQGVLWTPSSNGYQVFVLPAGPGGLTPFDARGINDAHDVVGKYGILGGSYHWHPTSGVTQIPTATFPAVPVDVNEQRQVVGKSYRMDLDTLQVEDLGNPTGTTYNYVYTEFARLNDAGECVGYAVVATSLPPYLPVRFSDGPVWKVFSNFPLTSAGASGISACGDTVFQLGIYGTYVHVNGVGSIGLESLLAPAYSSWDLTGSFSPAISRGGLLACNGFNSVTGEGGIVLLTPLAFENLGGASSGMLGTPVLSGYGSLVPGEPTRLRLASAAPNSQAYLLMSMSSTPLTLLGGILHTNPVRRRVPIQTDSLGRYELGFDWPPLAPGTPMFLQVAVVDPTATSSIVLSNALEGVTQ